MTEHKPGLHCHHERPDSECTLCTYRAMERAHDETIELLKAIEREAAQVPEEADEESGSAGLDGPQNAA